jgi:asparagine synthase (glutamine-hydrolysing)
MCAITGWFATPGAAPGEQVLRQMVGTMRHRGPDDEGMFVEQPSGIALGHRRLSIIDLSAASHQPMADARTGVVLAYNGELYNFRALREKLRAMGHSFSSSGDTEVVLRSYLQWGSGCFDRMAGMFALAIWDPRSATLHLARDAMGIKPLYFLARDDGFFFASELKALRAVPGFSAECDPLSLQQYLEFGYVFDDERTMLKGAAKLAPGHRLEVRAGRVAARQAWFSPDNADPQDTRDEARRIEELASVMSEVTREHLVADVPLGVLLSGGIDSSVVAALAARHGELKTVTMAFGRSAIDEREPARAVSEFIGSQHAEVVIEPEDVRREIEGGAWVFDDLFADWGTVTTRLLYRRCRDLGLKVVLVGEGADELFGGYDVFDTPARLGPWRMFRLYQRYAGRRWGRLFGEFRGVMQPYLEATRGSAFEAVRLFESRRQLPNQYVMKVDKASMAESVEARAPYLDRRIAQLAYRTPREWLLRGGENKYLLRALARRDALVPASTSARAKFGAPLAANWMDEDEGLRRFASEHLLDASSMTRRLGLGRAMEAYLRRGLTGWRFPAALSIFRNLAWRLLLLELWSAHYLGQEDRVERKPA